MKIGIFGGSFNPVHNGHIKIVLEAIETLKLDKIIIIPVGIPSHRNTLLNGLERIKMCVLAFQSKELPLFAGIELERIKNKIEISDIEVKNCEISYTYDTLLKIKSMYPYDEIYEIIGEDSAKNFIKWRDYEKILDESKVVVFKRKGKELLIPKNVKDKMLFLDTPYFEYSSTEIRERLKKGESIEEMTVEEVKEYILENKLYKKFQRGENGKIV